MSGTSYNMRKPKKNTETPQLEPQWLPRSSFQGDKFGSLYSPVSDWAALLCTGLFPASQTSPAEFDPGLNNHLMPAQTSLCHLGGVAPNASCGGVDEPLMVEMTFTPRLAAMASAAIWQSHQENFTCMTFTCLHAVNTAFLLFTRALRCLTSAVWRGASLGDRGGKMTFRLGHVLSGQTRSSRHRSHSGEAQTRPA